MKTYQNLADYLTQFDYEERTRMKIRIPELLELLQKNSVQFIDIRFPEEYDAWHFGFANMYLHHVEDPPAAIREMVRILKPGGKLIITYLDKHDFEFLVKEQHGRLRSVKNLESSVSVFE